MIGTISIRKALYEDIGTILAFVSHSRSVMRSNGNDAQWGNGYPGEQDIRKDISDGIGHIIAQEGAPRGYFALLTTPEPTYSHIEGGLWLDDTTPYGTLHRLCSDGRLHGIAEAAFSYCEQRCTTLRADTHRLNHTMLHILRQRGYSRCGVVYMEDGSPREAYQKMLFPMVTDALKKYVEDAIIPRYADFDSAHRTDHVRAVMAQSMELASHYPELNPDMVYAIAAYHDTGLCEGRDRHHLTSGDIIRHDDRLTQWFALQEIETMAQAAEDHRASAGHDPRSPYGRIVAEADRDIEPLTIVRRTVQYGLSHYPSLDKEGHWHRSLQHLREKYAPGGYLKLYIPESRNRTQMERLWELIADEARLRETFENIYSSLPDNQTTGQHINNQQP